MTENNFSFNVQKLLDNGDAGNSSVATQYFSLLDFVKIGIFLKHATLWFPVRQIEPPVLPPEKALITP